MAVCRYKESAMHWKAKATIFRMLSPLPFGNAALLQLQKHVTREVPRREVVLDELLVAAQRVLALYKTNAGSVPADAEFVEIGAGRDLSVALALRLLGVPRVVCIDITRLARIELVQHAATYLSKVRGGRAPRFASWDDVAHFGIEYIAPGKLQDMASSGRRFDCFYSTDVLEHIPQPDLAQLLSASSAMLKPDGLAIHAIDYSDHYARSHAGLSRFNFLTYSAAEWQRYNPSMHYVNRLRHSQFQRLFREGGYELVLDEPTVRPAELEVVSRLAPEFAGFDRDDLFTLRSWLVARPLAAARVAAAT